MADVQEKQHHVDDAKATYLEVADRFKNDARAPEALFRMAQLMRGSARPDKEAEARRILADIANKYRKSRWEARALPWSSSWETPTGSGSVRCVKPRAARALPPEAVEVGTPLVRPQSG